MAKRDVKVRLMTYLPAGAAAPRHAFLGEVVDVDDSDLVRFDAHNVAPSTPAAPPVEDIADVEVETPADDPSPAKPSGNASRDDWAAYALTQNVAAESLEGKSRDEIRELFA